MRYHYGTVVDVNDPTHSGLVRVRIHGLEDSLREDQLKWIPIAKTPTDPAINISGRGPIGGPSVGLLKGSKVALTMVDGSDGQIPMIVHSMPSTDRDDNTAAGSTNYAEKGRNDRDYNDYRLIAADDRTDPAQARVDTKTVHQYAESNAQGAYGDNTMKNIEDWTPGVVQGYSIGQVPTS
jgi:hypothetical protein